MKFAVIKTGGKQYKVHEGDKVVIEKLPGDLKEGDKVSFDEVLLVDDGKTIDLGTPVTKSKVEGKFLGTALDKKIDVIRYKAKSNYFKKNGHRQPHSKVEITSIK